MMHADNKDGIADAIFIRWLVFFSALVFVSWVLWHNDLIQTLVRTDPTRLSIVIIIIFLGGTLHCALRSAYLSARLREIRAIQARPRDLQLPLGTTSTEVRLGSRILPASPLTDYLIDIARARLRGKEDERMNELNTMLVDKVTGSHETGWFFAQLLVKLGLLGTVVGFIIMLTSISSTISYDATHVPELFSGMTSGMRVALNTTLAGLLGTILLSFQYLLVDRSSDFLLRSITQFVAVEWFGENDEETQHMSRA